jgi:hypothetical protein
MLDAAGPRILYLQYFPTPPKCALLNVPFDSLSMSTMPFQLDE